MRWVLAPPFPIDNSDGVSDFWFNALGALKNKKTMLDSVLPRRDWGDVRYPNSKNFCNRRYRVLSTIIKRVGEGWMVYRVQDIPDQGVCSISDVDNKTDCIQMGGDWKPAYESSNTTIA